jgi:two-component system, LytTR family, response regulator
MDITDAAAGRDATAFRLPAAARFAIPLVWLAVLIVSFIQAWLLGRVGAAAVSPSRLLLAYAPYALLWAAATPFILRSATRWPVRNGGSLRHVAIHLALACSFIIASNALLRLPLLAQPSLFLASLAEGVVRFGPWATLGYALIIALGHAPWFAATSSTATPTLRCETASGVTVIPPAEIDWVEAASNYVRVRTPSKTWLLRQPLSRIEETLPSGEFVRIHRSTLIAVRAVRELKPLSHGDATVVLRDGTTFRVPRTRRPALVAALDNLS